LPHASSSINNHNNRKTQGGLFRGEQPRGPLAGLTTGPSRTARRKWAAGPPAGNRRTWPQEGPGPTQEGAGAAFVGPPSYRPVGTQDVRSGRAGNHGAPGVWWNGQRPRPPEIKLRLGLAACGINRTAFPQRRLAAAQLFRGRLTKKKSKKQKTNRLDFRDKPRTNLRFAITVGRPFPLCRPLIIPELARFSGHRSHRRAPSFVVANPAPSFPATDLTTPTKNTAHAQTNRASDREAKSSITAGAVLLGQPRTSGGRDRVRAL